MPHERMRSLRWGRELLEMLAADETVNGDRQARAAKLLAVYPRADDLYRWVEQGASGLPQPAAATLAAAAGYFLESRINDEGDAETKRCLTYTLRHYPDSDDCIFMIDNGRPGISPEWRLRPEGQPF